MGCKTGSTVITTTVSRLSTRLAAVSATIGLAVSPIALQAQAAQGPDAEAEAEAPSPVASNPLGIPENFSLFGKTDPNVRKATAVVNGTVITGTDVDHRTNMVLASAQGQIGEAELIQLRMRVLRNLIDETLQVQAAAEQEITVSAAEVDQRYKTLAAQNFGGDVEAMDAYLLSIGSSPASLKRQIQGEYAWSRLIGRMIRPFINVSEEEALDVLKRLEDSKGQEEFHIMEIYMSATAETQAQVIQNARSIMEQLRQGASFPAYARQYSESSTAAQGGDLGYVRPGTLPPQMAEAVKTMQVGQLTGPIAIPGGMVIMFLRDKRQILMADPREAVLSLKQISLQFPKGITEAQAAQRFQAFQSMVSSIKGCGDAERAAEAIGAEVVTNDQIAVRDLPEQLQPAMLQLQVGQATQPFGSLEEGVRVLLLCGRDDPEDAGAPTVDQIIDDIEAERVQKRAVRYMRDLRNDAYIEYN
ncbi:MAG: peptidylprolyl isomerase [Sphingomonadaceae bacterium]|nr:MAG: peptidylprolyl isomerase [Sphingomonadaceae bacterium]